VRAFGLQIIKLVSLIRYFGLSAGVSLFFQLLFGSGKTAFYIRSKYFKNRLHIRSRQSDPYIFEQIFIEQQYRFPEKFNSKIEWILDAGANIGLAAVYFSNKYPDSKIICIEPDAENFRLLCENTSNYPNIIRLHAALWHQSEKLYIGNTEQLSAGYIVEPAKTNEGIMGITVKSLIEEYRIPRISIAKIDIEGAEKEVFESNNEWIDHCDCILVELHDHLKPGASRAYFNAMKSYDWETYVCGENIVTFRR